MKIKRPEYYFKIPKSEIAKDILIILLVAGIVTIAATSPFFLVNLLKGFKRFKKYPRRKVYDTFYRLKQQGFIDFYKEGGQIYFLLTKKGKKKTSWMQINDLKIKKTEKWDGKWRILMFDIAELKKLYREAFRGKLKSMGFVILQKSVWIIPYDCTKEIEMLKSFFGLSNKEIRLITVKDIGEEKDLKKFFKLD
ncbi:MAG: hypothetical protein AAB361_01635 [Patescibacteria group bacterium]